MLASTRVLVAFFAAVLGISWTCFSVVAIVSSGNPGALAPLVPLRVLVLYIGIFAPASVALLLTAFEQGSNGIVALLRRLIQWRVDLQWYAFAFAFMAAVKLIGAVVHRIIVGTWPHFGNTPWVVMIIATVASTLLGGQTGEEIGWRGFALPRLAHYFGYATASLVLGAIWALWHLPLFYMRGADTYGQSFVVYFLQVTALSVAIAWLYVNAKGSLLLTMLMHAAVNNTKDIVPSRLTSIGNPFTLHASPVAWITVALLWICAAYFLVRLRGVGSVRNEQPIAGFDGSPQLL